jgi:hypothetical protein
MPLLEGMPMEHRWGERLTIDVPVSLCGGGLRDAGGRLCDLSVSGALIATDSPVPVGARMAVRLEGIEVPGWVVRGAGDCFAVEWCEMAPGPVLKLFEEARHFRQFWAA